VTSAPQPLRAGRRLVALAALSLGALAGCAGSPRLELPPRPPGAPSGSEFAATIRGLSLEAREERIVAEVLRGNVPGWLRALVPICAVEAGEAVELWVTPDYLAVGSAEDHLYVPMTPQSALRIADDLTMSLPTPEIVDAIWASAEVKLSPAPIPPSPEMTTVPVFLRHSNIVRAQRAEAAAPAGVLTAGHKKDVVDSPGLASNPGRVAIYGWHEPDGWPIQPLYLGHTDDWVDYSHGVRLVRAGDRAGVSCMPDGG